MTPIIASPDASALDRAAVIGEFARGHHRMMIRNAVVTAAIGQGIEPEETMICAIVDAWEPELDPMIDADGKLGLHVRPEPSVTIEHLMNVAVRAYAEGDTPQAYAAGIRRSRSRQSTPDQPRGHMLTPEQVTATTRFQVIHDAARSTPEEVAKLGDICTALVLQSKIRQLIFAEMIDQGLEPGDESNRCWLGVIARDLTHQSRLAVVGQDKLAVIHGQDGDILPVIADRVRSIARATPGIWTRMSVEDDERRGAFDGD